MNKHQLKFKVIFWHDNYHNTNVSINLFGIIYHVFLNIDEDFVVEDTDLYSVLTQIVYFMVKDENKLVTEKDFKPHNVLEEEELEVKYFNDLGVLSNMVFN